MTEQSNQMPVSAVQPVADLSQAPMPNVKTLRGRQNPFSQLVKFIGFNLRILRMVWSSEH